MKIVFLIEKISGYHVRRLEVLATDAVRRNIELTVVELFSTSALYKHDSEVRPSSLSSDVKIVNVGAERNNTGTLRLVSHLQKVVRRIKPDVVVSLGFHQAYFIWFRLFYGVYGRSCKWIFCSDSKSDDGPRTFVKELSKRIMVPFFHGAFVAGNRHRDYWIGLGMPNSLIDTGYDVVDNKSFHTGLTQEKGIRNREILCVARLIPRKGVETLLRAFSRSNLVSSWRLRIVGDGQLMSSLQQLSVRIGIDSRVDFLGSLESQQMPTLYQRSDILVLPSLWDQWGLCVNEAFASGVAVIASDTCGCSNEIILPGVTGMIYPAGSTVHLAGMLNLVGNDHDFRMALASRARSVIEAWGPEAFSAGIISLAENAFQGEF